MAEVVVKPWAGRAEVVNLILRAGRWLLLAFWFLHGVAGAGNVLQAWIALGFIVSLFTWIAATQPLKVLQKPRPLWLERLWCFEVVIFCLVLAWHACWWLLAATFFSLFTHAMWRGLQEKALREREVGNG